MKNSSNISRGLTLLIFFALLFRGQGVSAQSDKEKKDMEKAAAVKQWVEAQQFEFVAQTVLPMSGSSRPLTTEYDLKVKKDLLDCYLPYFGRAYTAPIGQTEGGIQFKSSQFSYSTEPGKKGGWSIRIKPSDVRQDNYRLVLEVGKTGFSALTVTSDNRQTISYNGYLRELK
jgi:hypothetical protein